MDHQPFEDWLLADQPLTPEQKRELQAHLRTCSTCTAMAEVNLALRSACTVAPAAGFSSRWQARLALERKVQRRRQVIGSTILALSGTAMLVWMVAPLAAAFLASPSQWIVSLVGYLIFLMTSLEAVGQALNVVVRVVPDFIPSYVWLVLVSALGGMGLLWTISLWRFTRVPQKA